MPAEIDLSPDAAFATWVERQRWFASSRRPVLAVAGHLAFDVDGTVRTLLLHDRTAGAEALYQVPVVEHAAGTDGAIVDGPHVALADGPRDPAYVEELVRLVLGEGRVGHEATGAAGERVLWEGPAPRVTGSRVLSGEQSNTSIIVDAERADGSPAQLIVKVFRALHDGANPDVVLQSAIAAAGSDRVPVTYGALTGSWPDDAVPGGIAHGHLAVAQEFLPGTEDAWRVALTAARAGEDFTGPARELGAATAEVHAVLARVLPTAEADESARAATGASMRSRAEHAVSLVPELAGALPRVLAVLESGDAGEWPRLQRVHGDLHLGQVLLVPDRGWVLLDFEGEPLRPMAERNRPDVPLRDVAGMLRSFDYVAGTIELEGGDTAAPANWARAARAAFLDGYETRLGTPLAPYLPLLTALELDKALYECEYEVRNRPGWLPIPRRAVQRLIGAGA